MAEPITIYKIKNNSNGQYSHGIIRTNRWAAEKHWFVKWSKKGKEWLTEKAVKDHLMKVIDVNGSVPTHWEIMEFTQQPSKTLHDWIDANMLCKMLKAK
jgi:hypothetical protein